MLRHWKTTGFILLCLACTALSARANEAHELADEAMTLSGTRAALDGMAAMLETQTRANPDFATLSPAEQKDIDAILKRVFNGQRIASNLTDALAATGDLPRLKTANATMRAPTFQATMRQVLAASLAATEPELVAYAETFEASPPSPARIELVSRYDAATGSSQLLADFRTDTALRLIDAAPDDEATKNAERAKLTAMQDEIATNARNEAFLRSFHSFRQLDDAAVAAYVGAYETEAMSWLARHLGYALQRATVDVMADLVTALTELGRAHAAAGTPRSDAAK